MGWAMGVGELVWIWKWLPLCTFATPRLTPRSRFDSVVVDGLGGFVSFVVAVLNVVATPLGGGSHSPPVGKGGNVHDSVLCVGGGCGGCFCFNWISYDEFGLVGSGD